MNSIALVNDLHSFLSLLDKLQEQEQRSYKEKEKPVLNFQKSVSLRYHTITAKLKLKEEKETFSQDYIEIKFKIEDNKALFDNLYCSNEDREDVIKECIQQQYTLSFSSTTTIAIWDKEIAQYLAIADEIAKEAYLCSAGDNYYPGYFSEILVEDSWIVLKQTNHWNSRSIDHKKDYHLRDLEFYIPITAEVQKHFFQSEEIGKMIIQFSDRSSQNNKKCGERIFQKMQEQKLLFEKGT